MGAERSLIETERLIIRPFDAGDVEGLYRLVYADPEVRDAWSGFRETLEEFRRRFDKGGVWRSVDGFGFGAVVLKEHGALLGLIGFQRHEDEPRIVFLNGARPLASDPDLVDVELTYALGRAYWKRGYATEAGVALIAEGFDRLGIDRIVNWVDPHNVNTIGLMRRLGFRIEPNWNPDDPIRAGAPSVLGILERTSGRPDPTLHRTWLASRHHSSIIPSSRPLVRAAHWRSTARHDSASRWPGLFGSDNAAGYPN